ncbi:hypothetical protein ACFSYD_24000 [Paracoccus aerius]
MDRWNPEKADLVIVDMNRPHLTPQWMPVHRLIHQATGADVDLVMVDGNILLEGGRVTTTDEGEALRRAEQEAIKLVQRSGASRYMHDPGWGQLYRTFKE